MSFSVWFTFYIYILLRTQSRTLRDLYSTEQGENHGILLFASASHEALSQRRVQHYIPFIVSAVTGNTENIGTFGKVANSFCGIGIVRLIYVFKPKLAEPYKSSIKQGQCLCTTLEQHVSPLQFFCMHVFLHVHITNCSYMMVQCNAESMVP